MGSIAVPEQATPHIQSPFTACRSWVGVAVHCFWGPRFEKLIMTDRMNSTSVLASVLVTWMVLLHAALAEAVGPIRFDQPFSIVGGQTANVPAEIWAPDDWDRLRGVIVALPGGGHDSRVYAHDPNWQAQAAGHGFAIVGVEYTNTGGFDTYVGEGPDQVAENFQNLLDRMADELDHPELSNAPLLLFGHSHGSGMVSLVAQAVAERTLGFVADKYNEFPYFPLPPHFGEAPGAFMMGSLDTSAPPFGVYAGFQYWRQNGAKVALNVDWGGHDITNEHFVFAVMDETTKARYPEGELPSLTSGNPLQLVNIPESAGWLGEVNEVDLISGDVEPIDWPEIGPASEFTGDPLTRSWFPTETMAMVYRAHNELPNGMSRTEVQLFVSPPAEGETELEINVGTRNREYDGLELYDESGLIAQFGPGSGLQMVPYEPTELGNHTFVSVMRYTLDGESLLTSEYVTHVVTAISVVPEPSTALLLASALVWLGVVHSAGRTSRWG